MKRYLTSLVLLTATALTQQNFAQTNPPAATSRSTASPRDSQVEKNKKATKAKSKIDASAKKPGGMNATTSQQDAVYALAYKSGSTKQSPTPK
jgi:hypothetical protein